MRWILLFLALLGAPAAAQTVTPNFTSGSMTSTTTTTTSVTESVTIKKYGGDYTYTSGNNVTPSAGIGASGTTYSVHTAGAEFQLETVTRSAGLIEETTIDRTIDIDSVTNSLSVFSQ